MKKERVKAQKKGSIGGRPQRGSGLAVVKPRGGKEGARKKSSAETMPRQNEAEGRKRKRKRWQKEAINRFSIRRPTKEQKRWPNGGPQREKKITPHRRKTDSKKRGRHQTNRSRSN